MYPIREGIWQLGNMAWIFGLSDRTLAALADGTVTAPDLILLFTAALVFTGWLFLKPIEGEDA